MIDFKYYKELQLFCDKLGLPSDKETMRLYVKLVEKFNQSKVEEVNKLKMKNLEGRLQYGQLGVNRKALKEHIRICKRVIQGVDEAMKTPVNFTRGSRIAKLMTELDHSLWMFSNVHVSEHSSIEGQAAFEESLIKSFTERQDDLMIKAAFDGTKRRNLRFPIEIDGSRGGTANYNKKERRFDFIEYTLNGYLKQIPI